MIISELFRRIGFLLRRRHRDADLAEEMQFHQDLRERRVRERGEAQGQDAAFSAQRRFGNTTLLKETSREMWGWRWLDDFTHDLRYAGRQLRSAPAFSVIVVATLALGIGANTAVFSAMNVILYRALPVHDPDRIVYLRTTRFPRGATQSGQTDSSFSYPAFEAMREQTSVFSDVIGFAPMGGGKSPVRVDGSPEQAEADMVTGNFFSGLGVSAQCGRTFSSTDETSHAGVTVLSYGYWQRRFGGDCKVVGETMVIRGVPMTIVGVAAPGFAGVERTRATDLWIPLQDRIEMPAWGGVAPDNMYRNPNYWWLMVIARLTPDANPQQALARLNPLFLRTAYQSLPEPKAADQKPVLSFETSRGISGLRRLYRESLLMMQSMVALVLLIACGNVAMLLTARNVARSREFGVRAALGGGRSRLFRQLVTESLLLVSCGAALGWLLAVVASRALGAWFDLNQDFAPDRTVLLYTLALSTAAALAFGLAPFRGVRRVTATSALRTSSVTASSGRERMFVRKAVIAVQVAVCVVLLASAALLVRTLANLERADLGMRVEGLLVFGLSMEKAELTIEETEGFFSVALDRVRRLPGVQSATVTWLRLGDKNSSNTSVSIDGQPPAQGQDQPVRWNRVGSDFLATLGIPLLSGRDISVADTFTAPRVVVVNEAFAKRYFQGRDPLGHEISLSGPRNPRSVIVGVAANSKYTEVREAAIPMAYFSQQAFPLRTMHFEVRTAADPSGIWPEIRASMQEFAPGLPLLEPMTQSGQFARTIASERLFGRLALFFGLLSVVLIGTGVYGTLAYTVGHRTPEIGVRMALGARAGQVLGMVLRESLIVCAVGVVLGVPLALASTRFLESLLYGVTPADPAAFIAATAGILLVALFASLIPALRAAAIEPSTALRSD